MSDTESIIYGLFFMFYSLAMFVCFMLERRLFKKAMNGWDETIALAKRAGELLGKTEKAMKEMSDINLELIDINKQLVEENKSLKDKLNSLNAKT